MSDREEFLRRFKDDNIVGGAPTGSLRDLFSASRDADEELNKRKRRGQKKLDAWLQRNIADRTAGTVAEDVGAGAAAAGSALYDMVVPDDVTEAATAVVPAGKAIKTKKALNAIMNARRLKPRDKE